MAPLHDQGLQIVRYSPAERRGFEAHGGTFAGEDALIRFGKYPDDYGPWVGDNLVVGNVTQNMDTRGEHCGWPQWLAGTEGLPIRPAGTGSERYGGLGELSYPAMIDYLCRVRTYLYTGTQPASYTLGLMEAMLSGVPVVSIGPAGMWMPDLFEGHDLTRLWSDDPAEVRLLLSRFLVDDDLAVVASTAMRERALDLFDIAHVGAAWVRFLG
jgi:hypothetical protein